MIHCNGGNGIITRGFGARLGHLVALLVDEQLGIAYEVMKRTWPISSFTPAEDADAIRS
jgi:hypothetical protein